MPLILVRASRRNNALGFIIVHPPRRRFLWGDPLLQVLASGEQQPPHKVGGAHTLGPLDHPQPAGLLHLPVGVRSAIGANGQVVAMDTEVSITFVEGGDRRLVRCVERHLVDPPARSTARQRERCPFVPARVYMHTCTPSRA